MILHLSLLNIGLFGFLLNVDFFPISASNHNQPRYQPRNHIDIDLVHLVHQLVSLREYTISDLVASHHIHEDIKAIANDVDQFIEFGSFDHFGLKLQVGWSLAYCRHEYVVEGKRSHLDHIAMKLQCKREVAFLVDRIYHVDQELDVKSTRKVNRICELQSTMIFVHV